MTKSIKNVPDMLAYLENEAARAERELQELNALQREIDGEIERHKAQKASASKRFTDLASQPGISLAAGKEIVEQLIKLTSKQGVMSTQIEVIVAKEKFLRRDLDIINMLREFLAGVPVDGLATTTSAPSAPSAGGTGRRITEEDLIARAGLVAQEEVRRELAKAIHDGPAQTLTSVIMQAQIVQRLITRNPEGAIAETASLIDTVKRSLEATKGFIFDLRPMVLDDLGLVATLRRTARDRARRSGVEITFESAGNEVRLPDAIETGFFRLLDEAVQGIASMKPSTIDLKLDWTTERVTARFRITQAPAVPEERADLPPALAAMIVEQTSAAEKARAAGVPGGIMPSGAWSQLQQRARMVGADLDVADDGSVIEAGLYLDTLDLATVARDR